MPLKTPNAPLVGLYERIISAFVVSPKMPNHNMIAVRRCHPTGRIRLRIATVSSAQTVLTEPDARRSTTIFSSKNGVPAAAALPPQGFRPSYPIKTSFQQQSRQPNALGETAAVKLT